MTENNMLDDFLADNKNDGQSTLQNALPSEHRPKLKKIKRAKIRPAADLPDAPEKVAPNLQESTLTENSRDGKEEFIENSSPATALMKAENIQDITNSKTENSHILEGLPPELDYMMDENFDDEYIDNGNYIKKSFLYITAMICLFAGIFIGAILFHEQKEEKYGLEDVVLNPDVPQGRPRCGLTDKSQACILYIQNWYKQELNGRDFYKMAAQLTGREEYMIESDNMRYGSIKIKPGYFSQLNIPALK